MVILTHGYCKWVQKFKLKELLTEQIYAALFMLNRIQEGAFLLIVKVIVYSVKYFHISVNLEDPCDTPDVKKLFKATKSLLN